MPTGETLKAKTTNFYELRKARKLGDLSSLLPELLLASFRKAFSREMKARSLMEIFNEKDRKAKVGPA